MTFPAIVIELFVHDIETKVEVHDTEYNTYTRMVYLMADENIKTLKNRILEEENISKTKLEEGLQDAKQSRIESNNENLRLLRAFSNHLLYTRVGALENKEVYSFMATPISLYNKSDDYQTDTAQSAEKGTETNERKVIGENDNQSMLLLAAAVGGILIMTTAVVSFRKRTATEKFDS